MAEAKDFNLRLKKLAATIEANSSDAVKKTALAIDTQLVISTPVDTGRARANWLVGIGGPVTVENNSFPEGEKGSTAQSVTGDALDKASAEIRKHKPGQSIYISNNVKYLSNLNRGSSKQAPKQFIEKGILAGIRQIKGTKLLSAKGLRIIG